MGISQLWWGLREKGMRIVLITAKNKESKNACSVISFSDRPSYDKHTPIAIDWF